MKRLALAALLGLGLASPLQAKEWLYVCCTNHVEVLDPVTMNVTQEIPTKGQAIAIATNPSRSHLYLVDGSRELVQIVDTHSRTVVRTLTLSAKPQTLPVVRAFIFGIACDPSEKHLYLYILPSIREKEYLHLGDPYIAVVDLATGAKVKEVPAPPGIASMAPAVDGSAIYAFGRDIYRLDTSKLTLETHYKVRTPTNQGEGTVDYILEWLHHREGGEVAAASYFEDDPYTRKTFVGLLSLDLKTGAVDKLEAGPDFDSFVPFSALLSPDKKKGYMIFNQLMMLDMDQRRIISNQRLPRSYGSMTLSADGTRLYAAGSGSSVLEFDTTGKGKVVRETELPYDTFELMMVDLP